MKKRLFTLLVMALTLPQLLGAAEKTVYLKTGGLGDGSSPEAAVGTLDDAFGALDDEGGTIVICGKFTQAGNYPTSTLKKHTGEVLITGNYDGTDYRTAAGAEWTMSKALRFQLGGPVRIKDIDIKTTVGKNFLIVCNYNEFTMDEGVTSTGFQWDAIGTALTVLGGCQDNLINACGEDPKINIKGGEVRIAAFNRGSGCGTQQSPGTAYINISGGIIHNLFTGSHTKNVIGGSLDLKISGGKFVDHIYGGKYSTDYFAGGDQKVTITGGDFTECARIYFTKYTPDQVVDIDISGAGDSEFPVLICLNQLYNIDRLNTTLTIPGKVSQEGETFTASNGITIPYRISVPEGMENAKLPLLTYLHDNGSRGSDNFTHMYTQGTAVLYALMNFGEPCIMIAPQCPAEYMKGTETVEGLWIERDKYVAGPAYDPTAPQTDYMAAATELIDYIAGKYNVDAERMYLAGASNGAGEVWDMIVRFPGKFAAAVPVAGGGRDVTLERAKLYGQQLASTPVWTFHGDADATLPINGTICYYEAAKAAGAEDITFITVEGGTHNIWNDAALTPGLAEWMFSKKTSSSNVKEIADENDVKIIPGHSAVRVEAQETANVSIYTAAGCKLSERTISGPYEFSLLPGAAYLVVVNRGDGVVTHKKIIL